MAALEPELAQPANPQAPDGREPAALRIGRLYEQHYRMIRALCQVLLRHPVDAEDAAQQTFLSAFGSLIDGTVPKLPAPWLATIARRECWARTAQRRRQPLALDETNAPASAADNPLDEAIRNVDLAALWRAINNLPRQQRSAFLMREFSGLSYAEVAEALGASESAIESLLVRARRQLRDGLEPASRAANLIATPVLLLQHRLGRLLGERRAISGATAIAGMPAAAKLGAAVAGIVALGTAGVGVEAVVLHHQSAARPAPLDHAAQALASNPPARLSALDRVLASSAANSQFPPTNSRNSPGSPPRPPNRAATWSATDATPATPTGATLPPSDNNPAGATTTGSAPAPSDGTPTGDPSTAPTAADPAANPADPAVDPTASSNPNPSGDSPTTTVTAPIDTTPPADTTPSLDTTPTVDPTPADSSTAPTNPPPTAPAGITSGP